MLKTLLALLLAFQLSVPSEEMPSGGVKGRVLARTDRQAVEHARVDILQQAARLASVYTDAKGNFQVKGLPDGQYVLVVTAPELLEIRLKVNVSDGRVKNVFNVMLQAAHHVADDSPDALFGSWDIFANMSRYYFPLLRDNARGLPVSSQEIYLAGVRMDEVTPLELVSGLGESFHSHSAVQGAAFSADAFGGYNGAVSLDGTASGFRTGLNANLLSHSGLYYLRGQAAYGTGALPGGWTIAGEAAAHTPALTEVPGRAVAGYLGVDKAFSARHKLSTALFYTAAPVALARFDYTPSPRFRTRVTALGRWSDTHAATLHLAAAFDWQSSRRFSVSGGADGRLGTGNLSGNRRLELWMGGRTTYRRFGVQAGLRAGQSAVGKEVLGYITPKLGVDYTWGNVLISLHSAYFLQAANRQERQRFIASDANISYNGTSVNLRATGYVMSQLAPLDHSAGVELGFKVPVLIVPNVSIQGLVNVAMLRENELIPQMLASAGVSWSAQAWFVDADVLDQDNVFTVNLEAGKSWNLSGKYRLGVSSGVRNLLNSKELMETLHVRLPGLQYLLKLYLRM